VTKLKRLIQELRDSCSSEASFLADALECALEERDVDLGIATCDVMTDWAQKSKLVLQGKRKGL
jgi:hypothetical protein